MRLFIAIGLSLMVTGCGYLFYRDMTSRDGWVYEVTIDNEKQRVCGTVVSSEGPCVHLYHRGISVLTTCGSNVTVLATAEECQR